MYRLRRLCSRDSDFISSIKDLEIRCINSGYDKRIIDGILGQSGNLTRSLVKRDRTVDDSHVRTIRWVILSGTYYEKATMNFTKNLNELLSNHDIKFEVVRSTGSNLGRLLYKNHEKYEENCREKNCNICTNGNRSSDFEVHSKITSSKYAIDKNINCSDSGIYRITCSCSSAYTGKTTTSFNQRFKVHFQLHRESSIKDHALKCEKGKDAKDYEIKFLESVKSRGKFTLSEREYLWNERLGGEMNIQKILKNN